MPNSFVNLQSYCMEFISINNWILAITIKYVETKYAGQSSLFIPFSYMSKKMYSVSWIEDEEDKGQSVIL